MVSVHGMLTKLIPLIFSSLLLSTSLICKIVSKVKCEVPWDAYTGDVVIFLGEGWS